VSELRIAFEFAERIEDRLGEQEVECRHRVTGGAVR
jgi:hypothetical protein